MGKDYKSYLQGSKDEHRKIQESIFEKITLSEEGIKKIKEIDRKIKLLVFAEVYCPDCRVFIPFIEKIRAENENIKVEIVKRSGNEDEMEKKYGLTRIPSAVKIENGEKRVIYEEFPETLKEKIKDKNGMEKIELITHYRMGKFNIEIEKELIEKI